MRASLQTTVFVFSLSLLSFPPLAFGEPEHDSWTWFSKPNQQTTSCALVTHGLNLKPEAMDPLIDVLVKEGYAVLRVNFAGHFVDDPRWHTLDENTWLEQFVDAYKEIKKKKPKCRMLGLNFSLGGAVAITTLSRDPKITFEKMLMLAPAVWPRGSSVFIRALSPMKDLDIGLPSFAPEEYRVHDDTSLHAYNALFTLVDEIRVLKNRKRVNAVKTLVYMSPDDRVLDFSETRQWIRRNELTNWSFRIINPKPTAPRSHYHRLIDEPSLGKEAYEKIISEMLSFFAK